MRDFRDDFEMDEDGRLRRKRKHVLPDGATMHVPMGFYDGRFHSHFADGSPDHTSPHRPGHRFADVDDPLRIEAERAYAERNRRLQDGWRRKGEQQEGDDAAPPARTLDELRAAADAAYQDRNCR